MWLGELIEGIRKAESEMDDNNFGSARKRLHDLIEEARHDGIVTIIKIDC